MSNVILVNNIKIAFTKREVVDSIKDISFPGAVVANEAGNLPRKEDLFRSVVFKSLQLKLIKMHNYVPFRWTKVNKIGYAAL